MSETIIPVILAGGQGTRLWPSSLPDIPKQFVKMGGSSLMTRALMRALALGEEEVLVVTSKDYVPHFQTLEAEFRANKVDARKLVLLAEAEPKNTAPAIAYAVRYIRENYGNAIAMVITADHLIEPTSQFVTDVHKMLESRAIRNTYGGQGLIVSFGISPTHPETGYGYIECAEHLTSSVLKVNSFKEKPDRAKAEEYIQKGNFYWNSGMFCFPAALMEEEMKFHVPQLFDSILKNTATRWVETTDGYLSTRYLTGFDLAALEHISIDYAIMEKSQNIGLVQAQFSWNDVGSWDEAIELLHNTSHHHIQDSNNCSIYSSIPVGLAGVEGINVIVDNNRILIVKKGAGQLVSAIAKRDRAKLDKTNPNKNNPEPTKG